MPPTTDARALRRGSSRPIAAAAPTPTGNEKSPPGAEAFAPDRQASAGRTLFEIPFSSQMTDHDSARLARLLDMTTRVHTRMGPRHDSPGLARLDHHSGLFLHRGAIEGEWTLEGRTWGQPTLQSVHEWQVLAAVAARRLDPEVILPERLTVASPVIPDRPVGRAANKRLARARRRLVGLR